MYSILRTVRITGFKKKKRVGKGDMIFLKESVVCKNSEMAQWVRKLPANPDDLNQFGILLVTKVILNKNRSEKIPWRLRCIIYSPQWKLSRRWPSKAHITENLQVGVLEILLNYSLVITKSDAPWKAEHLRTKGMMGEKRDRTLAKSPK